MWQRIRRGMSLSIITIKSELVLAKSREKQSTQRNILKLLGKRRIFLDRLWGDSIRVNLEGVCQALAPMKSLPPLTNRARKGRANWLSGECLHPKKPSSKLWFHLLFCTYLLRIECRRNQWIRKTGTLDRTSHVSRINRANSPANCLSTPA